jgi:hypothetical protein
VAPAIAQTAHLSARVAAAKLNRRAAPRTASEWHAMQISRTRDRLGV